LCACSSCSRCRYACVCTPVTARLQKKRMN
jgi:hypothetical protein